MLVGAAHLCLLGSAFAQDTNVNQADDYITQLQQAGLPQTFTSTLRKPLRVTIPDISKVEEQSSLAQLSPATGTQTVETPVPAHAIKRYSEEAVDTTKPVEPLVRVASETPEVETPEVETPEVETPEAEKPIETPDAEKLVMTPALGLPPEVPEFAVKRWTGSDTVTLDQIPDDIKAPIIMPAPPVAEVSEKAQEPYFAAAETSEPEREVSPQSKEILNKIPAYPVKNKKIDRKPITISHAKDTPIPNRGIDSTTHESMGIKIKVKTPKINVDYELEKAYSAMISGRADAAIMLYKNVLDADPTNKNALFGLATLYHRANQLELARPLYAKLLEIDPHHRDGLNNFLVLIADEAPEDALKQLRVLQESSPEFSPIPAQIALIYRKLGDMDKASEHMVRAIQLEPENLTYRYNFAILLDKQRKYDEAAELYRQIVQAYHRGEAIPGNIQKIQQRLTFISSNRP
jgi:tetratricopeptide (TPR) repeat protein